MRDAFVRELTELAERDERVWTLTGDLGVDLFDELARRAPGRFLNVGVAEQNLVGVAAGLSYTGKRVFAYSIAPFLVSRPHDQIRVDVALARANVKLVGVGGGIGYGYLGPTHHAIEDLALTRSLPELTVLTPGDPGEAARATRAALELDGPVYLRLGKNGEPSALPENAPYAVGRAAWLRSGRDVTLATIGTMLPEALAAADLLAARGVDAGVLHYGSLKPFDRDAILVAIRRAPFLVSIEEHSVLSGFGSAVAEAVAESGVAARLQRLGLPDTFAHAVGSRAHLLRVYGLSPEAIAASAESRLSRMAA